MIERQIDYTPIPGGPSRTITVRIEAPQPDGEDWSTVLEIVGFHAPHCQRFFGVDSMSALLSAAQMAPVVLLSCAGEGTLTWLGESDLGFSFAPCPAESEAAGR